MNKLLVIVLFFIITILTFGCNDRDEIMLKYYPNGNIEYKRVYEHGNKCDYTETKYSKEGNIIYRHSFVNCKRDGKMIYYKNNRISIIKNYKEDSLNGIIRFYNSASPKNLDVEYFVINGKYISGRKYSYNNDSSLLIMESHLFYKTDTFYLEGFLSWDIHNEIIRNRSNYYRIIAADTSNDFNEYKMKVVFICNNDRDLRLELGTMNRNLGFINKPKVYFGRDTISLTLNSVSHGDNILMGKLYAIKDTLINGKMMKYKESFIFYHEFYAK